ncbi:hypothetical protein MSAN_00945200 [Mycena sanguinolenta]|uniref:Uncharacterized protein n=1 Tax=Mycena sanguinolenta TaxID=230812 RepID=A0A8H7DCT0_9AGAR|nr:hypothetical protein MSAN_00945200 [Mycena sanguinolenta]
MMTSSAPNVTSQVSDIDTHCLPRPNAPPRGADSNSIMRHMSPTLDSSKKLNSIMISPNILLRQTVVSPHAVVILNTLLDTETGIQGILESCFSTIEDIAVIEDKLDMLDNALKYSFNTSLPSPLNKLSHMMRYWSTGGNSTCGVAEPRIYRISLMASPLELEREEMRCLEENLQQNLGLGTISKDRLHTQQKTWVQRIHAGR